MHTFRHKFISILFALGQKKLSLKSDQLEVSGSVYMEGPTLMPDLYTPSKIYRARAKVQLCSMAALEAGSELSSGINKDSYSPKLEPFKIINETLDCQHCRSDHHQFMPFDQSASLDIISATRRYFGATKNWAPRVGTPAKDR